MDKQDGGHNDTGKIDSRFQILRVTGKGAYALLRRTCKPGEIHLDGGFYSLGRKNEGKVAV